MSYGKGYTNSHLPWDVNPRYENAGVDDGYHCSVCGDWCYDEVVEPHALDLDTCDKPECITTAIRNLKAKAAQPYLNESQLRKYEAIGRHIFALMADEEFTIEPIELRRDVLQVALAAQMDNKGGI